MTMTDMKSIVMSDGVAKLAQRPVPTPGAGQVLVRSRACGICGSDLHILRHTREVMGFYREIGVIPADSPDDLEVQFGHEFSAEIVAYGPATQQRMALGTRVTSVPILVSQGNAGVGVVPDVPGAYSEYFVLDEALLIEVPEGVSDEAVAMTEPLAVGLHAVNRGAIERDEVALVAGCGPIGLSAIAALRMQGVKTIVASDPQQSRLEVAQKMGATHIVNPRQADEVALAAELAGERRVVIYECVGIDSLIPSFILRAPANACIVFTGLHTHETPFNPAHAMVKELDVRFAYYYEPQEFAEALQWWIAGDLDWRLLCSGKVGIDGVVAALDTLMQPNDHIKVIVEPWRNGPLEPLE